MKKIIVGIILILTSSATLAGAPHELSAKELNQLAEYPLSKAFEEKGLFLMSSQMEELSADQQDSSIEGTKYKIRAITSMNEGQECELTGKITEGEFEVLSLTNCKRFMYIIKMD